MHLDRNVQVHFYLQWINSDSLSLSIPLLPPIPNSNTKLVSVSIGINYEYNGKAFLLLWL